MKNIMICSDINIYISSSSSVHSSSILYPSKMGGGRLLKFSNCLITYRNHHIGNFARRAEYSSDNEAMSSLCGSYNDHVFFFSFHFFIINLMMRQAIIHNTRMVETCSYSTIGHEGRRKSNNLI